MLLGTTTLLSLLLLPLIIAEAYGDLEVTGNCQYPTEIVYGERTDEGHAQCDGNKCEEIDVSVHAMVCISALHKYSIIPGKHLPILNWMVYRILHNW